MKAILVSYPGGPEQLFLGEYPLPEPGPRDLRVRVHATALNRADILQRKGHYPPPPGESPILSLEIAGEIEKVGEQVTSWQPGDRVCGLIGGGGYAEYALIHEDMAMPVPVTWEMESAAALPEAFLAAYQSLVWLGRLSAGECALIHAGASGVGAAAIQLARLIGAEAIVTASAGKHDFCKRLGAALAVDYKTEDFAAAIRSFTKEQGVDMILDCIGAPYFQKDLDLLRLDGRLVYIAMMGGSKPEAPDLSPILRKRLSIIGTTLRNRSLKYKVELTRSFRQFAWEALESGQIKPFVDRIFPWEDAAEAHRYMEDNKNQGKIVLKVG